MCERLLDLRLVQLAIAVRIEVAVAVLHVRQELVEPLKLGEVYRSRTVAVVYPAECVPRQQLDGASDGQISGSHRERVA